MTVNELRLLLAPLPGTYPVVVAGANDHAPHAKKLVMVTRAFAAEPIEGVCVLYTEAPEPPA